MSPAPSARRPFAPQAVFSDIYPLDEFYAARGEVPRVARIAAARIPEPYRSLLDHQTDMTSTLEKFHGETLHIEVLERHARDDEYYREVVLVLDRSRKRVEFGAIKINLDLFPAEAQKEIRREQQPLGRILNSFNISFSSRPSAFLSLDSDNFISASLQLPKAGALYGRRNSLLDAQDRPLAEIVEILPP